jgi:hypothetical protein
MKFPRETVFAALFNLLTSMQVSGSGQYFQTTSRHLLEWGDVAPANQPALFLREGPQVASQAGAMALTKWTLKAEAWIYLQAPADASAIASSVFNPVLDAIDLALQGPVQGWRQQLAAQNSGVPLVEQCWIDGPILINDPVPPDTQVIVVVPISLLTG